MIYSPITNGTHLQDEFLACGRGNAFSPKGFDALFDYLEDLSEQVYEDHYSMCVDELCGAFNEFKSLEEFNSYGSPTFPTMQDLHAHRTVIDIPNSDGFIIED